MPALLFTGKGGVGKTTLAAATAAGVASRGRKTLAVSTDPAHSLADAFDTTLGGEPSEVDTCLHACQIDSRSLVDKAWQDLRTELGSVLAGAGVDTLDAAELTVLPGVDELVALTEVQRLIEQGPWQDVVVDCGPTAETLRLLSLPEAISGYVSRLYGKQGRVGSRRRRGNVLESVERLAARVDSLQTLLRDPTRSAVRLVLTPQRVVAAEARRTLTSLALRGIRVDGMIVNRMVPAPGWWRGSAASWLRARRAQQEKVFSEMTASLGDVPVRTVEHRALEPVGMPALLEIAAELYGETDPLDGAHAEHTARAESAPLRVIESENGYELRVALPLDRASEVDLARVDDDLAVTVDGFRRLIALPEALRACRITGAESDAAGVVVSLAGADGLR